MYAEIYLAQTLDLTSVWTWLIIALVVSAIAAAFGIYNAQRGMIPNQTQALDDMKKQIDQHQKTIGMLQDQATTQWAQSMENKTELAKLRVENAQQKQQILEQQVTIQVLQRQLAGLASGNRRTGKRLREVLKTRLNETELREWAQDLDPPIPFESLAGETLPELVLSILDTLERYGRLDEALQILSSTRPDLREVLS